MSGILTAQELEPAYIEAKVLQGEKYEYEFYSGLPASVALTENIAGGNKSMEQVSVNISYKFIYDTDPNFVGESRFLLERYANEGLVKQYTEVIVKVVPSMIEARRDVVFLSRENSSIAIDALSNDTPGFGALSIESIDLVSEGTVQIVNDELLFTKPDGFEGETSFNYTIVDEQGHRSSSTATINVQGQGDLAGSSLSYITSASSSVDIYLDDPSYDVEANQILTLGILENLGGYLFTYTPLLTSNGFESFLLINDAGETVEVEVEILEDGTSSQAVRDDDYFTSQGTLISFDPRENDFNQEGIILDYSDELDFDGSIFSYQPESGYSGVKTFTYTVLDGATEKTANIDISVGNYLPQQSAYSFQTYANTDFPIDYKAPISDYNWSIVIPPSNGYLATGVSSHVYACGVASGNGEMVIYDPKEDFVGKDQFTIEYCVDNGACKEITITMEVVPTDEACPCQGNDCVWAGDADNDGKVSVKDVLAIGYNYGETGDTRFDASGDWGGNHAIDWAFLQDENRINNKFADGNGDGVINSADAATLNENISLYHNINAQEVLAQKEVPLVAVLKNEGDLLAGDVAVFDIYVGSVDIPVEDLRGIVFSLGFPPNIVDASTIKFNLDDSWIGSGSTILSATHISESTLEVGVARTANTGVFGSGKIGEVGLVIRVDTDGWRPGEEEIPFDINFSSAQVKNNNNKNYKIPGQSLNLTLKLDNSEVDLFPEVMIYPNPSQGVLTFHANNNDELVDVQIYNIMGALVMERVDIAERSINVSHNLPEGMYSAAIKTQKGVVVEKIQVLRAR